jgi:hypothetical protein
VLLTVSFNHFKIIAEKLHNAEKLIVGETAAHIAEVYSGTAARDTGYMASSSYYRTSDTSTYGTGGVEPPKGVTPLPEVEAPPDDTTAYAAVAAPYSIFPELGTRYQAAQPAFYPAVEAERPLFADKISHIEDYLR